MSLLRLELAVDKIENQIFSKSTRWGKYLQFKKVISVLLNQVQFLNIFVSHVNVPIITIQKIYKNEL